MTAWTDQGGRAPVTSQPNGNSLWAQGYAREIQDTVNRQADRAPRTVQRHLGPSELGVICHRQVIGKMVGPVFPNTKRTNHVASPWPAVVGTAVHAWLAQAFDDENARIGVQRFLTEMRVAPTPEHPGTTDLFDYVERAVVDHKVLGPTTLAKIRSPSGPPRKYRVQLLLYWLGCLNAGLPAERIVIIAYPRTAPSLDNMYVWEHIPGPADIDLLTEVLRVTALRREIAAEILKGGMRIEDVPITPDSDECYFCVSGETEVVTRDGIRPIASLAGTYPELLIPDTGSGGSPSVRGNFRKSEVRSFGQQELWTIRLHNHGAVKEIRATAEHRWIRADRVGRPLQNWTRTTAELRPGDKLRSLRAHPPAEQGLARIPEAVARGFVYGDGCVPADRNVAEVSFFDRSNGKYEALMPFFPDHQGRISVYQTATGDTERHIGKLPTEGKRLPGLNESSDYLLSWLAGYFAADGNVSPGGQVTLASAREANMRFAQEIAAICGVGYGTVCSRMRLGYGTEPTPLYTLTLRRRDLPDWFLIRPQHLANALKASEEPSREGYWTVESVTRTGKFEEVFCAVVPGIEAFALKDSIMTSNCPFYRPQAFYDGGPGCPGTLAG